MITFGFDTYNTQTNFKQATVWPKGERYDFCEPFSGAKLVKDVKQKKYSQITQLLSFFF